MISSSLSRLIGIDSPYPATICGRNGRGRIDVNRQTFAEACQCQGAVEVQDNFFHREVVREPGRGNLRGIKTELGNGRVSLLGSEHEAADSNVGGTGNLRDPMQDLVGGPFKHRLVIAEDLHRDVCPNAAHRLV